MKEERHVIWSNYGLDYEDWRDDLEADYPDLSEDERISLMYEINGDYLYDERTNLNVQLSQPILIVGDLGLWNGRRMGYKEIPSGIALSLLFRTILETSTAPRLLWRPYPAKWTPRPSCPPITFSKQRTAWSCLLWC